MQRRLSTAARRARAASRADIAQGVLLILASITLTAAFILGMSQ